MENITFDAITPEDYNDVERMIIDFYKGCDDGNEPFMTDVKVRRTIAQSLTHPDHVKIVVFKDGRLPVGYCIMSAFWSNEYGGMVLLVDELSIIPEYRGQGIGTHFLEQLSEAKEYVALNLKVFHENTRAFELYQRLGFGVIHRRFLRKPL